MLKIKLHKNFIKSFEKLDNEHKTKVIEFLENLKGSESVKKITGIKKLSGSKSFYRFRLGNYRIGFVMEEGLIKILILKSRGDFYKIFPKNYL